MLRSPVLTMLLLLLTAAAPVRAGSILLTGHDVLLHSGQNGFDTVTLNFLRGAGTASEISAANYDIAVVGSGVGSWSFTEGGHTKAGFGSTTFYNTNDLAGGTASWSDVLSKDVLVILSHTSCGGCDLSTAGSAEVNAQAADIAAAINAGMDLWGLSGADLETYYEFLPPSAVATGAPIGGSSGFTSTAAGLALGFTDAMINGFPTHNRFFEIASAFTVFETRGTEIITIGVRDARIGDGGIIPEPSIWMLLGPGMAGLLIFRRRSV